MAFLAAMQGDLHDQWQIVHMANSGINSLASFLAAK
jgi:hypothetical protein